MAEAIDGSIKSCENLSGLTGRNLSGCDIYDIYDTSNDKNLAFIPIDEKIKRYKTDTENEINRSIVSQNEVIQSKNKEIEDDKTSEKRLNVVEQNYKKIRIAYYVSIVILVFLVILFLLSYSKIFNF